MNILLRSGENKLPAQISNDNYDISDVAPGSQCTLILTTGGKVFGIGDNNVRKTLKTNFLEKERETWTWSSKF